MVPNKIKKNTEIFFVLTSNSSIRDNKNYENFNKYLLPYFQKNNFEVVKNLSIGDVSYTIAKKR